MRRSGSATCSTVAGRCSATSGFTSPSTTPTTSTCTKPTACPASWWTRSDDRIQYVGPGRVGVRDLRGSDLPDRRLGHEGADQDDHTADDLVGAQSLAEQDQGEDARRHDLDVRDGSADGRGQA